MHKETRTLFPRKNEINKAINAFSYREMIVFIILFICLIVSAFLMLKNINEKYLVERPTYGGTLKEGVIGSPRFINPVLATSNTDRDLTSVVFSGLMKKGVDGTMENDLAQDLQISENKLTYTFTLRENAVFHDGTPVKADDVVFTINQIQDGKLKSPSQASWQSVVVTKENESTVSFRLPSPYASFLESTSVGILPSHIWKDIDVDDFTFSDLNIFAIGSGSYQITKVERKKNGVIESISLKPFKDYYSDRGYISKIKFVFFKNEDDLVKSLRKNNVDQINAISGEKAEILKEEGESITTVNLSRVFGLFFNSNKQEIFRNKNIVEAIGLAIDKDQIVREVLNGYGQTISSPIPFKLYEGAIEESSPLEENIKKANEILDKDGWVKGEGGIRSKDGKKISFSISTGDASELQQAAQIIKTNLEKVGISVEVKVFEIGSLNQSIIRPREYESLFFGQIIGSDSDLFAFWHSSQRNDPGLNIASYTNSKVDGYLEKLIAIDNQTEKIRLYKEIESEIKSTSPAIFIYSPEFIYVTNKDVKNIIINKITFPSERLSHINEWYIRTEKVWEIFNKTN